MSLAIERTFIMVKPDGVARGLVGEIFARLERKGLAVEEVRSLTIDEDLARTHYAEHEGKPFFTELVEFVTSGPVVVSRWSGESAVSVARTLVGATDPKEAAAGTIRGDFGLEVTRNLVHAADSSSSAERELALFFE